MIGLYLHLILEYFRARYLEYLLFISTALQVAVRICGEGS